MRTFQDVGEQMSPSEIQELEQIAGRIVYGALAGRDAAAALAKHSSAGGAAADAVHLLYHIAADSDLRASDRGYRLEQDRRLEILLGRVRGAAT